MKKTFLIVGDNHLDSKTPISRLDNYCETGIKELEETLLMAEKFQVDYYILLGDIFNRIDVGGECRNQAIETLASNKGTPWSFKKYATIGNHDIAHNMSFLYKSAFQTLLSSGVLECQDSIPDLPVRFLHFTADLDLRLKNGELEQYDDKIIFLHASIVDKPMIFDHVLFSEMPLHKSTKLVYSGHIHRKMEVVGARHADFYNPGSLGRNSISSDYEKRRIGVYLMEFDFDTNNYRQKYLELKSSLPYDQVFDIASNNKRKMVNRNTELFIDAVTNVNLPDITTGSLQDDFTLFATKRGVKQEVIKYAINEINFTKEGNGIQS